MYTAQQLADRFGLKRTTIHQYVWRGILPPPTGKTSAARYTNTHVTLLKAYQARIPTAGDRFTRACFAERRQDGRPLDDRCPHCRQLLP